MSMWTVDRKLKIKFYGLTDSKSAERREYRMLVYYALIVCGELCTWNANIAVPPWVVLVYYNIFGNGRQMIGIPSM